MTSVSTKVVAVIGATGVQGRGVVEALQERGEFTVRALTRNPSKAEGLADEVAFEQPSAAGEGQYLSLAGDLLSWDDIVATLNGQGHNLPQVTAPPGAPGCVNVPRGLLGLNALRPTGYSGSMMCNAAIPDKAHSRAVPEHSWGCAISLRSGDRCLVCG